MKIVVNKNFLPLLTEMINKRTAKNKTKKQQQQQQQPFGAD